MAGSVGQYTMGAFLFAGVKASASALSRFNSTTFLGMGYTYHNTPALNDYYEIPLYFDSVTWKCAIIHEESTNDAICSILLDGVSQGTIDFYASPATQNNYDEITGIAVTTAGAKDFRMSALSKNASSSNYEMAINSWAWIRTGGTPSTPSGTDTPGYTHELFPWMATKTNTGYATRTQSSSELGGGRLDTDDTAQNNLFTYDIWLDTRTYKVALINDTNTDQGIYNITGVNGTQTVDGYGALTSNVYTEVTGIAVTEGVKTVQIQMATKNALSSAYGGRLQSVKWISTGA